MSSAKDLLRLAIEKCQTLDDQEIRKDMFEILKNLNKFDLRPKEDSNNESSSERKNKWAVKDNQSTILCSIDKNFKVNRVGDYLLSSLQIKREAIIGVSLSEFFTEASKKYAETLIFPEIRENDLVQEKEVQIVKTDGLIIDVILTAMSERDTDGHFTGAVISLDDVSELVGTKKALSHANKRYYELYHSTSVILCSLEKNRRIINVSNPCLESLHYRSLEMVGQDILKFLDKKSHAIFEERVFQKCLDSLEVKGVELEFISDSGKRVRYALTARLEVDDKGDSSKVFFILENTSEQSFPSFSVNGKKDKKEIVRNAIQTPLKNSLQKLETLRMMLPENHHKILNEVIEHLSDDEIFRPHFTRTEKFVQMDAQISKWLITEYSKMSTESSSFSPLHDRKDELHIDLGILNSLSFNTFEFVDNQEKLIEFIIEMFQYFNLLDKFNIDKNNLHFFLHRIKTEYRNVPFHNFLHAFDITQMIFYMLTKGGLALYLTDLDILALLISVIGHDTGHPGLNGNYQEVTMSPLALTYNDQSILESHHASSLFKILQQPGCEVLKNLSKEESQEVRNTIISNILSTDMQHHFEILTIFGNRVNSVENFDPQKREDRLLLMKISLKCADVSNAVRPFWISRKWSQKVLGEYFLQGDLEKAAGLPVSAFMDREITSIPKSQIAFIEFIVKPLYGTYSLAMAGLQECLENLEHNCQKWQEEELQEEKKLPG